MAASKPTPKLSQHRISARFFLPKHTYIYQEYKLSDFSLYINMQYFNPKTIKFFEDLSKNNYREWFHEHKNQYIESVKDPFDRYLTDLIAEVRKHDKKITIEPKQAKFRINRDVRFRKNKEPYKLHVSGVISPGGRKDRIYPGLYVQIGMQGVCFGSGRYSLAKEELYALRAYIIKHPRKFKSVITDPALVDLFGDLQ